jgi:P-type E1-E2 ATPase
MSRAAKHGIIIKTGGALERLAEVKTIAFDKTGTLTEGKLVVDTIKIFGSHKKADVLGLAAALEQKSTHILAQAIVSAAIKQDVKIPKAKNIKEQSGKGLLATVGGRHVLIGRQTFLAEQGVDFPGKRSEYDFPSTATTIAINGELAGVITFKDEIRPESSRTLKALRYLGVKHILMVTGDNQSTAKTIARKLGLANFTAEALPADKLRAIEEIQDRPVAFVGDGVNDAPVLTAADIGIALGARGETAASESADMVIMLDDISRVARALDIAKRTFSVARQSILVGIALSIILMIIFSTGHFQPLYGAILQEGVDVVVIFNALRALNGGKKAIKL